MAGIVSLFAQFVAVAILLIVVGCVFSTPFRRVFFFGIGAAFGGAIGWVTGSVANKIRDNRKP